MLKVLMKVNGEHYRTIWLDADDPSTVLAIDQQQLPHEFQVMRLCAVDDFVAAIKDMRLRGAGLIGAAAGYGMYVAALTAPRDHAEFMREAAAKLLGTRPTAVNLAWAVKRQLRAAERCATRDDAVRAALRTAVAIADEDAEACRRIGLHGKELIVKIAENKRGETINILTHCNAGWLAFVDHGAALSPVYAAFDEGIKTHVWVDETRPRNQGAALTCWELGQHGVPHTLVADNAGGHLMQRGMVDLVLVGADRVTRNGDAANKIGTYLKALAAKDNGVPFYVALPSSSFDLEMVSGLTDVPIEERDASEVCCVSGKGIDGKVTAVQICPEGIGYGNVSMRVEADRFIITGSATGSVRVLARDHYALVESIDLNNNCVHAVGKINASAETMSHGAVYRTLPGVNSVIHIHSRVLFDYMRREGYPETDPAIPFGTPELAFAISDLVTSIPGDEGVFVTAGHDEGVMAYGATVASALAGIRRVYAKGTT